MKKIKVTFWLLGFGCGIVLAGIMGTLIALQVEARSREENKIYNQIEKIGINNEEHIEGRKDSLEESALDKNNSKIEDINNNQMTVNNKEEVEGYCEIFIPSTSGAGDICAILEKAGIIKSGKDFHEYIKAEGKQTYLKDGTFKLPKYAEYETLLMLLLA